ncbi:hypothetical protein C8263_15950 [Deinococcus arcticus]|uniref:Uncharacterized protein n=1 Tax=Deinococcus arcticus TaxID=2136176 RepID=A0A2T3W4N3_9DEIO|nr:hypothetical protein C8263_15950 [Deinococcus arcticus]
MATAGLWVCGAWLCLAPWVEWRSRAAWRPRFPGLVPLISPLLPAALLCCCAGLRQITSSVLALLSHPGAAAASPTVFFLGCALLVASVALHWWQYREPSVGHWLGLRS